VNEQTDIQSEVGRKQMIACPHCAGEFAIHPVAHFKEQTIYLGIKHEGDSMSATTFAGVISNMDKLLRSVAQDLGYKAHVFISSIERAEGEVKIGFLVCEARPKKKGKP
jgi:hypothetical protein